MSYFKQCKLNNNNLVSYLIKSSCIKDSPVRYWRILYSRDTPHRQDIPQGPVSIHEPNPNSQMSQESSNLVTSNKRPRVSDWTSFNHLHLIRSVSHKVEVPLPSAHIYHRDRHVDRKRRV